MPQANLPIWYVCAVILGALFAYLTVAIYVKITSRGSTADYWSGLASDIQGLLFGDESNFWGHYKNVIAQTLRYVVRQLTAVFVAFAPLVFVVLVLGPKIIAVWESSGELVVVPAEAGTLHESAPGPAGSAEPAPRLRLANGNEVVLSEEPGQQAICSEGRFACLVLVGFGFKVHDADDDVSALSELVVIRSHHGDWNPLWPYLSDPEFLFFLALSVASIIFFLRRKSAKTGDSYEIGFIDYFLVQLAHGNAGFFKRIGDRETANLAKKLGGISVEAPVFIAGLARSGTTILLEKLAGLPGVGTHRYRDFPFVMMPVWWNRFLGTFAAKQRPIERPHKDKIEITRDSPDAFEEPIWQHFFPQIHDDGRSHRFGTDIENPVFAQFYRDHIKKILMIRKGTRYLSKGNYNVMRIEYIASIFPDARFLIPIRHPVTHVESLVRQHELFCSYAKNDQKVPEYLRAVGHYEFGPQRVPVCISPESGEQIRQAWNAGDDFLGYALQWADVYGFILSLLSEDEYLRNRMRLVRFEDLCRDPGAEFGSIVKFIGIGDESAALRLADGIGAPPRRVNAEAPFNDRCWSVLAEVASEFGYVRDPDDISEAPMKRKTM